MLLSDELTDKLSLLDGTLFVDEPLGQQSWFRCGGHAQLVFEPNHIDALSEAFKLIPEDVRVTIIGGLANTIVRDGGVDGVVIRLKKPFADVELVSDDVLYAGAGALNGTVASLAAKNGIAGLEFLSGIPGTMGGATAMNAGAYGREIKDCLVSLEGVSRSGDKKKILTQDLDMTYRKGNLPAGLVVTNITLKGRPDSAEKVRERLRLIKEKRNATQPIKANTGGSTFANPSAQLRAWQVVEQIGGRELKIGGASMSEKHLNFMINDGTATATDLEHLGDELKRLASQELNIELHWEIKRIGHQ